MAKACQGSRLFQSKGQQSHVALRCANSLSTNLLESLAESHLAPLPKAIQKTFLKPLASCTCFWARSFEASGNRRLMLATTSPWQVLFKECFQISFGEDIIIYKYIYILIIFNELMMKL